MMMSALKKLPLLISLVLWSLATDAQTDNWRTMMKNPDANFFDTRKAFYKYWEKKKKVIGSKEFKNETDAEGSDYNVFRRWEYRNRFRVMPDGFLPPPDHAKNQYFKFAASSPSPNGNWKLV